MKKLLLNLAIIPIVFIAINIESKGYTLLFLSVCVIVIVNINDNSNFKRQS